MESIGALMSTIFFEADELANVAVTSVGGSLASDYGKSVLNVALDNLVLISKANAKAYNVRYPNESQPAVGITKTKLVKSIKFSTMPNAKKANDTLELLRYNLDDQATVEVLEAVVYFLQRALRQS